MNCREFKEQFEDGRNLSKEANTHLSHCLNCESFHIENLQLTQMISSLPIVEAPKGFEFGFRSKLAQNQLNKPLSPIWRMLRYVLPLSAATLIFGFVIINSSLFTQTQNQQIVEDKKAIEMELAPAREDSFEGNQAPKPELVAKTSKDIEEPKTSEKTEKANNVQDENKPSDEVAETKPQKEIKKALDDDEIMSRDIKPDSDTPKILNRDSALSVPIVKNPAGINPEKKINTTQINPDAKSFTAKEILSQLGIETGNENGLLKVNSVRRNSTGARSGVKVGDFVTAIDGQKIFINSRQSRKVQGKSLTIKRGNKRLNVTLRNN